MAFGLRKRPLDVTIQRKEPKKAHGGTITLKGEKKKGRMEKISGELQKGGEKAKVRPPTVDEAGYHCEEETRLRKKKTSRERSRERGHENARKKSSSEEGSSNWGQSGGRLEKG